MFGSVGEDRLNSTAHVCTGENVQSGDTFVTCGGEQPDATRASHDADNKTNDHRLQECKNA